MTFSCESQNSGNEWSSLPSYISLKLLVWTNWTNLNVGAIQNARQLNSGHRNFNTDFRSIFWERTMFYRWKENFACCAPPNLTGASLTSSCWFPSSLLQFRNGVSPSARWKHFITVLCVFDLDYRKVYNSRWAVGLSDFLERTVILCSMELNIERF